MPLLSAIPAAFWLIAESVIALALVAFNSRISAGGEETPWHGRSTVVHAAVVSSLLVVGSVSIGVGPSLFAIEGAEVFGRKAAWNLLCLIWVILEWLILVNITLIVRGAEDRYLALEADVHAARSFFQAIPYSIVYGVITLGLAAFASFHATLAGQLPRTIELWSYAYVRGAGFLYIGLEAGIAFALYKALRLTRRLLAEAGR